MSFWIAYAIVFVAWWALYCFVSDKMTDAIKDSDRGLPRVRTAQWIEVENCFHIRGSAGGRMTMTPALFF